MVINLFGAPGSGKSTGAAEIFAALKKKGINAELVTEFAKDKTWEHNNLALSCQEYVFGKQSYRLTRCKNDVDIIITDSPLPLSLLYIQDKTLNKDNAFQKVVMNVFNSYDNLNYFIVRDKPYNPKGRNQTEAEAEELRTRVLLLLQNNNIEYKTVLGNDEGYASIIRDVFEKIDSRNQE